jgi:hypothetical protein
VGLKLVENQTWLVCLVTFQLYWLVWLVQALKSPEKKSVKILMYAITATDELHSTVTLHLPHLPHAFPVFHTSEVQPFQENDDDLFPHRALHPPAPILQNGEQEFFIDKIVDERRRAKQIQYRIRWQGEGPEGDKWLPASEVEDCEALDIWLARNKAARQRRKK